MNEHIKRELLHGRLVLLLGAGASLSCKNRQGEYLPNGNKLAAILAEEMGEQLNDESLSEVYSAARHKLASRVDQVFEDHFYNCKPSREIEEILKFPFTRIYTLNIDDAVESALAKNPTKKYKVYQRNDEIVEADQFFERLDYIKLNGDIRRKDSGYIFSPQEYSTGSVGEPFWYNELARDFHRYTFIFIGTNLNEPLFNHHIEKYKLKSKSKNLKSYILVPDLTSIQQANLASNNIEHLPGRFTDFVTWLSNEFPTPPTSKQILINVRPEFKDIGTKPSLFDGVIPVNRSSLHLIPEVLQRSKIRNFYKGFKPTWFDIIDEVPAWLCKVDNFYQAKIKNSPCKALDFLVILGPAGCGKSTALKQIALKVSDIGKNNVFFVDEYKEDFLDLIAELDIRNSNPYFVFIERLGGLTKDLTELLDNKEKSKAIIIGAENSKIWNSRVSEHLEEYVTGKVDLTRIEEQDAETILIKLKQYGIWTRLSKMTEKNRKIELLKKAQHQLLIGLLETTLGEGYNDIIKREYASITQDDEKSLLLLAGLATTQRVPANQLTLNRALNNLGFDSDAETLAENMDGILYFDKGNVVTRHRVYVEKLFGLYVETDELYKVICAYLRAFTVYEFPLAKSISKDEFTVYKHLANAKALKRTLKGNQHLILAIYEEFEKEFELEGLFLMQYGLALRLFNLHKEAYHKLLVAQQAFPESPHIEHALALQQIILACRESDENTAMSYFFQAEEVLKRLYRSNVLLKSGVTDRYPIITLSEGHVKVLDRFGRIEEARIKSRYYYDLLSRDKASSRSKIIQKTLYKLMKYSVSGVWKQEFSDEF